MTMKQWHAMGTDEVAASLGTDFQRGLAGPEAARRLGQYGTNELRKEEGISPLTLFLASSRTSW